MKGEPRLYIWKDKDGKLRYTGDEQVELEILIREATARGYCHYINEHKVLDPDLLNAITDEVIKVLMPKRHSF